MVQPRNYIGASSVDSFFPAPDAATHERELLLLRVLLRSHCTFFEA